MYAACKGYIEIVSVLLAAGADINLQDKVSDNADLMCILKHLVFISF